MDGSLIRVLLIEDDKDDYIIMHHLFSDIGRKQFDVEWIQFYHSGLERLTQHQHDVYLIDYQLGTDSGLDLLREAITSGCNAPIILLTEQGDREIDIAAMKAGAADYLVKGKFDAIRLERAIRYAIERHRTLEELRQALREKSLLASAINNLTIGIVITDAMLPNSPVIFANPSFTAITGYELNDILGKNCSMLQGVDTDPITVANLRQAIANKQPITCILLNYRKDGSEFWNELTISPVFDGQGTLTHFIGLQTDITAREQSHKERCYSEEALRESEERYALAVQGANDGIWDWNLRTSEVYYSTRWKTMLGYAEDEIGSSLDDWFKRVHPEDLDWLKMRLTAHLNGLTPHFENEHRMCHSDNRYRWVLSRGLAVRDSQGEATRIAGSQTDITDRKQAEERLLHNAFHDALTNLPNRALLIDRLQYALQRTKRSKTYQFAVLFLDLDRFKVINDSLGHMMGDQLLIEIARRLTSCIRPGDIIARLGGDEFVVLLDINSANCVTSIANRIQQELSQPFNLGGHEVFTTASIGIALSNLGYDRPEDLLRDADTAMYWAKAQGKARHEIFNMSMHTKAVALLHVETDLRRAVSTLQINDDLLNTTVHNQQEFQLHYQPIVSLQARQIIGFEALLRWTHPQRGMISPDEFIPIAEETGLIVPLGNWVLWEACRQVRLWQASFVSTPPFVINVNLSGKQFTPQLISQISQILAATGVEASSLKLEITESILMENAEAAITMLSQLKALGIQLAIDDFGTGYSSLSYLHRFPIDTLKIDRSFISKIDQDGEQLAIVRTIMTLAWNLGMDVVAEGIETSKQLAQLKSLRCEHGQGYLFSAPLNPTATEQLLTTSGETSLTHL